MFTFFQLLFLFDELLEWLGSLPRKNINYTIKLMGKKSKDGLLDWETT